MMTLNEVNAMMRDLRYVQKVGSPWQVHRATSHIYRWQKYKDNKDYYDGLREEKNVD